MQSTKSCLECGAIWKDEETCQDYFYQMLFWESEYPNFGEVHHLVVLCYHLQHPSLYSNDGLEQAKQLLIDFLEGDASPQLVRKRNRDKVNSHNRKWNITATADSIGDYINPIRWEIIAQNIVESGTANYCENVRNWAGSILTLLKTTENLYQDGQ